MRTIATRGMHLAAGRFEERMMRAVMPRTSAASPRGFGVEIVRRPVFVQALTVTIGEAVARG